jgi:hypothetical protein
MRPGAPYLGDGQLREKLHQFCARKGPPKRLRDGLIAMLKRQQLVLERGQGREIIRRQNLALHDREIDLDLIEPARMGRGVDGPQRRPVLLQAGVAFGPAMRRSVIHDPENAPRRPGVRAGDLQSVRRYAEARQSGAPERGPGIVGHD